MDGVCFYLLGWVRGSTKAYVGKKSISFDGHGHEISQVNNLQNEINSLKTSVSNGKSAVASAITDKGVSTSATATFDTMATNIRSIASAPSRICPGWFRVRNTYYPEGEDSSTLDTETIGFYVPNNENIAVGNVVDVYITVKGSLLDTSDNTNYNEALQEWIANLDNGFKKIGTTEIRLSASNYSSGMTAGVGIMIPTCTLTVASVSMSGQWSNQKYISIDLPCKIWKETAYNGTFTFSLVLYRY